MIDWVMDFFISGSPNNHEIFIFELGHSETYNLAFGPFDDSDQTAHDVQSDQK